LHVAYYAGPCGKSAGFALQVSPCEQSGGGCASFGAVAPREGRRLSRRLALAQRCTHNNEGELTGHSEGLCRSRVHAPSDLVMHRV
jgi:hypothetical protein